jgi:hypothetical protein
MDILHNNPISTLGTAIHKMCDIITIDEIRLDYEDLFAKETGKTLKHYQKIQLCTLIVSIFPMCLGPFMMTPLLVEIALNIVSMHLSVVGV